MEIDELLKLNNMRGRAELVIPLHKLSVANKTLHGYLYDGDQVAFTLEKINRCRMKINGSVNWKEEPSEESIERLKKWARDANRIDKAFWKKIQEDMRKTDELWKEECKKMNDIKDKDFGEMCDYIKELHRKKNADYGNSFSTIFKKRGWPYAMGHLEEKMNRIDSISANGNKVEGEKLEDSLVDLACYALMTVIELRREDS